MKVKYLDQGEAFKIAMNLEEEGEKFYRRCARITANTEAKHIFSHLADEERVHFDTFRDIYGLSRSRKPAVMGSSEEKRQYLAHLVRPGVFFDLDAVPGVTLKHLTEIEAIHIGIQVEKDSILFYTEAWRNATDNLSRKAFKRILLEEHHHLNILIDRLIDIKRIKK